jgi:hypothetical protein
LHPSEEEFLALDMLNKIMVIRSTVKPHEKSKEEGSKDPSGKKSIGPTEALGGATDGAGVGTV